MHIFAPTHDENKHKTINIIMKKLFIFTSAAVSLLLAGCAKNPDQEAEQRHGRVVTLSATIDVDENTKASVGNDGS